MLVAGPELRAALAELFAAETGIDFAEATTLQAAPIDAEGPDALLVSDDCCVADTSSWLRRARAAGFVGAALLLARDEAASTADFDACLRRPLRFSELAAKISLARALRAQRKSTLLLGDCEVCVATHTLHDAKGARHALTEKEVAILERLAQAQGEIVAREVLLRDVWGYNAAVVTHTLETHIHRLRRKIDKAAGRPGLLATAGGGYRLAAGGACAETS
jgi:DNA-binding response OmpR family regulator